MLHIGNNSLIDKNKFASYMFYHCYDANDAFEMRYNTMMSKEMCDQYKAEYDKGNNICGRPVHINKEIIDNWYPQTLSERIDYILLYFAEHTKHIGQNIKFDNNAIFSLLFVDRYEISKPDYYSNNQNLVLRTEEDCKLEALYVLDYLKQSNMISYSFGKSEGEYTINISPLGYNRVDELQKNSFNGKSVLVAMKFGQDTIKLREAIRKGITDAGYVAIFIDEVQHNDFITPELLKHIRDSKFVVADLTHQNNGAYFEEGYAMGLGNLLISYVHRIRNYILILPKRTQ